MGLISFWKIELSIMELLDLLFIIMFGVGSVYVLYVRVKFNPTLKSKFPFDKGTWRRNLFLIVCLIPLFTYSQNVEKLEKDLLPLEIKQYYKNLNLVNSFSTSSWKMK